MVYARCRKSFSILLFSSLCLCGISWAQIGGIDAEFAGAGARALSMGGAFIGLADDSTAAEFNPAGIHVLVRPELAWQVSRTYDQRDEFNLLSSVDSEIGTRGSDSNQWTTPSFASFVLPREDYTLALTQLTTIDFVHRFDEFAFGSTRVHRTEARNNAFGITYAKEIRENVNFGITGRMNRFYFYNMDPRGSELEFSDWAPSVNIGLLWRAHEKWSFGTVFKSSQKIEGLDGEIDTQLPETWGVGVAYHPNDDLRILADVDYINWSEFDNVKSDPFRRQDVTRYHLGAEYLLDVNKERAWFIRGGVMREESNAFYFDPGPKDSIYNPEVFGPGMPKEDDLDHVSAGLGLAKETYQLDLAVDHVFDGGAIFIVSMIHYF